MAKIGNSSSKYDYDPDQFDVDIKDKIDTIDKFRQALEDVIYKSYRYKNNIPMSKETKRAVLIEVHKEFIGLEI